MTSVRSSMRIASTLRRFVRYNSTKLCRTPLHELHLSNGGKMVSFAGFEMPLTYGTESISSSHKWVRKNAGLFDVSHMVQHMVSGKQSTEFLERITPTAVSRMERFTCTLSVLLNPKGGIVDDTVICRQGDDKYYIVTNAGCRSKVLEYFALQMKNYEEIEHSVMEGWGLIALQGPKAAETLQKQTPFDLSTLRFGQSVYMEIDGLSLHVSRGGYTGEDGFEISIPSSNSEAIARSLLESEEVKLAGLGARDTLRLEAGMCLYGNDLDETTTPIEAGLGWVVSKSRRENGGFLGDGTVLKQLHQGVARRRIGLIVQGAPARQGASIVSATGEGIGIITSGCPSPTLGQNIAMGYVATGHHQRGTAVGVEIRGRVRDAIITKMPFVSTSYFK